jgi:hypothetical protein
MIGTFMTVLAPLPIHHLNLDAILKLSDVDLGNILVEC